MLKSVLSLLLSLALAVSYPLSAYADSEPMFEPPLESSSAYSSDTGALSDNDQESNAQKAGGGEFDCSDGTAKSHEEAVLPEGVLDAYSIGEILDFVYLESSFVSLGGTQRVVVSFADLDMGITSAKLQYQRPGCNGLLSIDASDIVDGAVLFELEPDAIQAVGEYELVAVQVSLASENPNFSFTIALDECNDDFHPYIFSVVASEAVDEQSVSMSAYAIDENGSLTQANDVESALRIAADSANDEGGDRESKNDAPSALSRGLDARRTTSTLQDGKLVVALDPGHGGSDSGAVNEDKGLQEKNLTLKIAQYCKLELEQYFGIDVYMTRTSDEYVGLEERVNRAIAAGSDVFVSIHINSAGGNGAEVWVPNDSSWYGDLHDVGWDLGNKVLSKLVALGLADRGVKFDDYIENGGLFYPDGSPADGFSVIRNSRKNGIPGIIVEHAFIDNAENAAFLQSDDNLKKLGMADAEGIAQQYGKSKKPYYLQGIDFSPDASQGIGQPVLISARVSGDTRGLNYKYVWHKSGQDWNDGQWGIVKDLGGTSTVSWQQNEPGDYEIFCDVVDATGDVMSSVADYRIDPWAFAAAALSSSEPALGDAVTVSASVQGDTAGLSYKYSYENLSTGEWRLIAAPSASASITWRPPSAGPFRVYVDVADSKGYKTRTVDCVVSEDWSLDSFTVSKQVAKVGETLTISAKTSGNNRALAYKFVWMRDSWADWGVIQQPAASPSVAWAPPAPGNYTLFVDVLHSTGVEEYSTTLVVGTPIMGDSKTTVDRMVLRYQETGHIYPATVYASKGAPSIRAFCELVFSEAQIEGVRAEVLFAQAMYETGWLQFGGSVKASQCNFGGLGAVDSQTGGAIFPDVKTGLLAQAQHLKAYASTNSLNAQCVDPRFSLVSPRGIAPCLEDLNGRWAVPGVGYGERIAAIANSL